MPARTGHRLAAGQTLVVQIAGVRGIPAAARAISANLTVVDATDRGFVTAFPCGEVPTASNVNYELVDSSCQRGRTAAVGSRRDLHLLVELRARHHRRQRLVELNVRRGRDRWSSASIP